jgi:hypothetical protein
MAPPVRPRYNVRFTPLRLRYGLLTLNPWSGARWSILLSRSPAHVMLQYHVIPPHTPFRFVFGFVFVSMTFRLHAHGAPPRRLFSRAPLRSLPGCLRLFDGFPAVWRHEGGVSSRIATLVGPSSQGAREWPTMKLGPLLPIPNSP